MCRKIGAFIDRMGRLWYHTRQMIQKILAKNFRSIGELDVNLTFAEGKAPNDYEKMERIPFVEEAGIRCVPIAAIFGANAAGKSNIVRALVTVMQFMTGQNALNGRFLYDPNRLLKCGEDIELQIDYTINGNVCSYAIRFNASGMKSEIFICNGSELYRVEDGCKVAFGKSVRMPSPEYNPDMFAKALKAECTDDQGRFIYTFASLLAKRFKGLNDEFKTGLIEFSKSVVVMNTQPILLPQVIDEICSRSGQDATTVLREIVDIIRELDVDILAININEYEVNQDDLEIKRAREAGAVIANKIVTINSTHQNLDGKNEVFDFMNQESDGTIRLATMIGRCLLALKTNGVLCVDELERSLHPILVRELLKLFQMRYYNEGTAQMLFTTHLVQLLDDSILRLSEVIIVDKNRQRGTKVKRLIEMKNAGEQIRNVTNFRKRYLKGYYSGVPKAAL